MFCPIKTFSGKKKDASVKLGVWILKSVEDLFGEMAERSKADALKAFEVNSLRGFESYSLCFI
jgi:hypothetical protein